MPSKKIFLIGFGALFVCVIAIAVYQVVYMGRQVDLQTMKVVSATKHIDIVFGSTTIRAEIVDTEASRQKGLSGREGLASSTGLFFVFDVDNVWGIWMKDMKFAIDVVWFDKNGTIVGLKSDMTPKSYPNVFLPEKEARFILEMEAGMIKKTKIKMGDQVKINFVQ